jgi:hypothetical protein
MDSNKKGQFFILAAVILAVIILGLGVVYNNVYIPESSEKFYSYSEQLDREAGAVVDYSLYSGNAEVGDFMNQSVNSVLSSYPDLSVFTCYTTKNGNSQDLTCDNYGTYAITIFSGSSSVSIPPGSLTVSTCFSGSGCDNTQHAVPSSSLISLSNSNNLIVQSGDVNYSINLTKAKASKNQYYFVFRANTSAGNSLSSQSGV